MLCLKCGGKTKTLDTRYNEEKHYVRRRRRCLNCRHKFTTYEVQEDNPETIMNFKESLIDLFEGMEEAIIKINKKLKEK